MVSRLDLGGITVDVVFKDIKHVYLSIYPPTGRVRISAPWRMSLDTIRVFAISRLDWIKRHQEKLRTQERETPRAYLDRESHYVWGKRYLLRVVEENAAPRVALEHSEMILTVRPGRSPGAAREAIVARWYREQIKAALAELIPKWEPLIGVEAERVSVRRMKTRWGSCSPRGHSVRFNTELATKPGECLEYVVVHELVHLIERSHNQRFTALMDEHMPHWRQIRKRLNTEPLGHDTWSY